MTVLLGDTGKVAYGTLKTFNFSFASPREVSLGSSALPNTEGATSQVSFTVQSSDLPSITPAPTMKYTACIIVSGKCGTAATTVNYRILKNGSSVITSSASHTATQFWTQTHWRWFDVQVGDVLDVRSWANVTDATIDYCALVIYPVSVGLAKPNTILKDYSLSSFISPNITGAGLRSISVAFTGGFCLSPTSVATTTLTISVATIVNSFTPNNTVPEMRSQNGGDGIIATTTSGSSSATQISIQRNTMPSTISFREVLR